ncbi:MAG: PEP-CTERM sorting domain-containing protein [Methylococcales bacterium]
MTFKLLSLAFVAGLAMSAPSANAAIYNFTQTGFDFGASLSGSFQATDLNADGKLITNPFDALADEITDFTFTFSGNSIVSGFTHSFSDLTVLYYTPTKSVFGVLDPEGLASNWFGSTGYMYESGVGATGAQGANIVNVLTGAKTISENFITVTPAAVPVPGAVWLFGSVLAGFIGAKRRKN